MYTAIFSLCFTTEASATQSIDSYEIFLLDDIFINSPIQNSELSRGVSMKKNKIALGLSLTILAAFLGGGVAHATGAPFNNPVSK